VIFIILFLKKITHFSPSMKQFCPQYFLSITLNLNFMSRFLLIVLMSIISIFSASAANADFMRSIGKIYVVVGVMLLLFLGITLYLILIDRRLTKFENQIKSDE